MHSQPLKTSVNGEIAGSVATSDRAVLFGDGVFETLAVNAGKPCFWLRHMARLQAGCHQLGIATVDEALLTSEVETLLEGIIPGARYVLKIIVSRGRGGRGYQSEPGTDPTRILQLHDWPEQPVNVDAIRVTVCTLRLGNNPRLAGIKHLNRLEQVLARAEWDNTEFAEGLLLDHKERVIEGTMSNLFLVFDDGLVTPDLSRCGVAGIMRNIVMDIAQQQGIAVRVRDVSKAQLFQADELFLCNSLTGIRPIADVGSNHYGKGAVTTRLQSLLSTFNEDRHVWRS